MHTALSTLLFPLLDRLLGHNPGSVEGGIKTDVLADGKPGAWLLQYPPQRDWNAVTDELDCLDLDLRWIVGGVQFDTIQIAEISASSIQVLAKIRFSMRVDMGDDMVSPVLPLPRANFLSNQHDISHFEWESGGVPPHVLPHDQVGPRSRLLAFNEVHFAIYIR